MELTQANLKSRVDYNAITGEFTWKDNKLNCRVRKIGRAGTATVNQRSKKKYFLLNIFGRVYSQHRLAWLYHYGSLPGHQIDHIDGNGLNNSIENLRDVTAAENAKNRRLNSNNTSGRVGVVWHKASQKWIAQIKIKGKPYHLGVFKRFDLACVARSQAEKDNGFHKNNGKCRPL